MSAEPPTQTQVGCALVAMGAAFVGVAGVTGALWPPPQGMDGYMPLFFGLALGFGVGGPLAFVGLVKLVMARRVQ